MIDPSRIMREVSGSQDKLLRILDSLRFATIENVKIKDGKPKYIEIRISIDLEDPAAFKKTVDELRTIPL